MLLFPLALLVGVLTGAAAGGRISTLTRLRLRVPGIVILALAVQMLLMTKAGADLPRGAHLAFLGASYAGAGIWLAMNIPRRPVAVATGLVVVGVGWLLNMCVVLANGDMPVSLAALTRIGAGSALVHGGGPFAKHVQLTAGASLSCLGDTIPVVPLNSVVSIGDLVMLIGLVVAVAAAMQEPRPAAAVGAGA